MGQLDGKTALVTGANSGIGLATARRFAAEGAYVFLTGRRERELDEAVKSIVDSGIGGGGVGNGGGGGGGGAGNGGVGGGGAAGGGVTGIRGDVSDLGDLDRVMAAVAERGRGLDVLFTNAGGGSFLPLGEITPEHFDETFGTNVRGTLFTVQKALPLLNEGASVVLAGSTAASNGTPAFSVYAATKAAIRSFARSWAAELADRGIRVNAIAPGPTETPGLRGLAPTPGQAPALLTAMARQVPLGRLGTPDEIAAAVLFLASDQSSFVTGSELFADGGANQI
jgi:NAD(P)-dependent dehydrogenase (short-subunit alcohol dehydrogenase family)